jgi:hypothetical protein
MPKPKLSVGDKFILKDDIDYSGDEIIIYEISEARRSNTEFQLQVTNPNYWSSNRWINTKQVLKRYRPLTEMERMLYV